MSYHPEEGDKVFMYSPVAVKRQDEKGVIARKLISGWSGPWMTKKKLTEQVYEIESMGEDKKVRRVISCDRLEPYREGYAYDAHKTSVALPENHPYMKATMADLYAEEMNQGEEDEAAESELPDCLPASHAAGGWNVDTAEAGMNADSGERRKGARQKQQSVTRGEPEKKKCRKRVSFQNPPVNLEVEPPQEPVTERERRAAMRAAREGTEGERQGMRRRPEGRREEGGGRDRGPRPGPSHL